MRAMKDSGVEWIGEIPEEWETAKLGVEFYMKGRIGWQGLRFDDFIDDGPFLVTGTDFDGGRVDWNRCYHISEAKYFEDPAIHLKDCDLLFTKDGTVGKVAYIDHLPGPASLNSHLLLIRPKTDSMDNRFLFWMLQSTVFDRYKALVQHGSVMDSISQTDMSHLIIPLPGREEQLRIVRLLDEEIDANDGVVTKVGQQISILERYRASVIHEAVTRGLDPSVPTKPSGVEWIGEIPEGWIIRKLKHIVHTFESGTSVRAASYPADDGEKGVLSLSAVFGGQYNPLANKKIDDDEYGRASCSVRSGCLLVSRCNTSEWVGLPAYVDTGSTSLYLPDKLWQIDFGSSILNKFVWYALRSKGSRDYCFVMSVGSSSSMQNISSDDLLNMHIPLPPLEGEMRGIVSFLDRKLSAIDAILDTKRKQLDILKRRRQSLIYEYVTGKRRVGEGD